jgi:transcriptional regulator with XRE-family HTH domain
MLDTMAPQRRKPLAHVHPLRQWREQAGKSQQDVAHACHLTQAMISFIESGRRIPLGDALEALRTYTGLPTDAFIRPDHFLRENPGFFERRPPKSPDV